MPPRKPATVDRTESESLREEIHDLRNEMSEVRQSLRVLIEVMDSIREDLSWLSRNGFPREEPLPPIVVLKEMAADPCDPQWGEKLVMVHGDGRREVRPTPETPKEQTRDAPVSVKPLQPVESSPPLPELVEFFVGDSVEFIHEGRDAFGEIVAVDAGRDRATVMLVPGGEHVEVPLGRLELVPPDDEEEEDWPDAPAAVSDGTTAMQAGQPHESRHAPVAVQGAPPPGKLFADSGDQKRLF